MTSLSKQELVALAQHQTFPSVSILLSMDGPDGGTALARLRAQVREAGRQLAGAGVRDDKVRALLAPARDLEHDWLERPGWTRGLALYANPTTAHRYWLPQAVRDAVVIGYRFHLLPLVPLVSAARFFVLALAQGGVRLYAGNAEGLTPCRLPGAPASLADAMRFDDRRDQLQLHQTGPARGRGRPAVAFHGHGVGTDDAKDRALRYLQEVDRAVCQALHRERVPLVLAGVDWVVAMYRHVSAYPHLAGRSVYGNPEHLPLASLHEQAAAIAAHEQRATREAAAARARQLAGTGRTVTGATAIAQAAEDGRVEILLLPGWAWQDPHPGTATQPIGPELALLNVAAGSTVTQGGMVLALEEDLLPEQRAIAICRY